MNAGREQTEQDQAKAELLKVWGESWVTEQSDGSALIRLAYPFRTKELEVTELRVRRLKGRDMKHLPSGEAAKAGFSLAQIVQLLHVLCDQPRHVIDELDTVDVMRAGEVLAAFFMPGPATGAP